MNAFEHLSHVRRHLLAGFVAALCGLVALSSCGRNPNTAAPDVKSESAAGDNPADFRADAGGTDVTETAEEEAAEDVTENFEANDQAWAQSAKAGEFKTEYQSGETTPSTTAGQTVVLVGAGDIANSGSGKAATAKLIDGYPNALVFTAGDNAYSNGSTSDFSGKYAPSWGRFKARTRPAPGNHDYNSSGAKPYYSYFGSVAGPSGRGYYSYNYGDWHVISLNSNISMAAGSAQDNWLKADLAANRTACALAYWHHPRFSSGSHGSSTKSSAIWNTLYNAGVDIVLVGHDHDYERFAPMTSAGKLDQARGIREFVVGMGGTGHRSMGKIANSEARNANTYGILKLTLAPTTYQWQFIPVAGGTYKDSGSGTCHN